MIRQPQRFRERVLAQFRTPQNTAYLAQELEKHLAPGRARDALMSQHLAVVMRFASTHGQGGVYLDDDPLAQRGRQRRGADIWEEVRRLNAAFLTQRIRAAREEFEKNARRQNAGPVRPLLDEAEDDEPLSYRMFVADSLRPPGLENLNGPGPLWALNEDQFARSRAGPGPLERARVGAQTIVPPPGVAAADMPWGDGKASRTPEQAVAEYYGTADPTGQANSSVLLAAETAGFIPRGTEGMQGRAYDVNGDYTAFDRGLGKKFAGTRFERRTEIPRWQRAGHRAQLYTSRSWREPGAGEFGKWSRSDGQPLERAWNPFSQDSQVVGDTDETLGSGSDEWGGNMVGQVRGWDMRRLRNPQGEQYRTQGPNAGYMY